MTKIAIVGCGKITTSYHLPAALVSPRVQLSALVDVNVENARALAEKYKIGCQVAQDLNEVISQVDGVLIATPNHTHFPLARIALAHGKPVLIEKPMTIAYSEAIALCELAENNKSFISVGFKTRYYPSVILLKRLLEEKKFGEIYGFHYEYGTKGGWSPVSGYNINPEMSGGGVLINGGTHFIDRMLYWFGEPAALTYEDDSYGGVEANCKAVFSFEGFTGTLFVSKTVALKNGFFLDTQKYLCELGEAQSETITLYPKDNSDLKMELSLESSFQGEPPRHYYFQKQLEEFANAIETGGPVTVSGRFAARSVKLIETMYKTRSQLAEPWRVYNRPHQSNSIGE